MAKVAIILGSASDYDKMKPCWELLETLEVDFFVTISSAHRTPERTAKIVAEQEKLGANVFICAAGMAAHLAGAVAARTICPVIGVPLSSGNLAGMDALFSTVQMPAGFPVATVALDKAGAKNAAWLAAQIIALQDKTLAKRLETARKELEENVIKSAEELFPGHAS